MADLIASRDVEPNDWLTIGGVTGNVVAISEVDSGQRREFTIRTSTGAEETVTVAGTAQVVLVGRGSR